MNKDFYIDYTLKNVVITHNDISEIIKKVIIIQHQKLWREAVLQPGIIQLSDMGSPCFVG